MADTQKSKAFLLRFVTNGSCVAFYDKDRRVLSDQNGQGSVLLEENFPFLKAYAFSLIYWWIYLCTIVLTIRFKT